MKPGIIVASLGLLVALLVGVWSQAPNEKSHQLGANSYPDLPMSTPKQVQLPLNSAIDIFDFGLAKINADDQYDAFTINHGFEQTFLMSGVDGQFEALTTPLQALAEMEQPGMAMRHGGPEQGFGVHVYRYRRMLYFISRSDHSTVHGEITIPRPADEPDSVTFKARRGASAEFVESAEPGQTRLRFAVPSNGRLIVDTLYIEVPMSVTFAEDSVGLVLMGYDSAPIVDRTVTLQWYDRHSMAWARINSDQYSDAYLAMGGLRGRLDAFPDGMVSDQLWLGGSQPMIDVADRFGFAKGHCRAYRTEWVDFDVDNDLDLYLGCMGGPNQLFEQTESGQFREIAQAVGVDLFNAEQFRWVDWDDDGAPELVYSDVRRIGIMDRANNGRFNQAFMSRPVGLERITDIRLAVLGDTDYPSAMVLAGESSHLLARNVGGGQALVTPDSRGLPITMSSATWVDFNFDGKLDYYDINAGLFIRHGHRFSSAKIPMADIDDWVDGQSVWWIDQSQGCWSALQGGKYRMTAARRDRARDQAKRTRLPTKPEWDQWSHWSQLACTDHWLVVDLQGPPGNQDGIGSVIDVRGASSGRQRKFVNGSDDSRYSQGHYRSYFGVAQDQSVEVSVRWPDGQSCLMQNVGVKQRIVMDYTDCRSASP